MRFLHRKIEKLLADVLSAFPSVVLTGPRRAGKTTILRRILPKASYALLEDPDILARVRDDPRSFLDDLPTPAIIDEIQNAPELFSYIRSRIDAHPRKMGQWLLTGSQEFSLMRGVTESMAGRSAILRLMPLSLVEAPKMTLLSGGYPEALDLVKLRGTWFSSYLQTYLERDVRSIANIRDLGIFRRFLALVASRHGQVLNSSALAAPLSVSVPTIQSWLDILEITGQIILVEPYFENLGKRLIKRPKLYLADSGLACHLLGIETAAELQRSPFYGFLFEGMIAAEILKSQVNAGKQPTLYYFRDQQGLEVDFLFPAQAGQLRLIECKAGRTALPSMAKPMLALKKAMGASKELRLTLVHQAAPGGMSSRALTPGVEALDFPSFVADLNQAKPSRRTTS